MWHPLASRPDPGSFDAPASLLLRDQGGKFDSCCKELSPCPPSHLTPARSAGYWLPYRDCHAFLVAGDVNATVGVITSYLMQVRHQHLDRFTHCPVTTSPHLSYPPNPALQGESVNPGLLFRDPQTLNVDIFFGDDFEVRGANELAFPCCG